MLGLVFAAVARAIGLWCGLLVSPLREGRRLSATLVLLLAWPLFCGLQILHWLGFALDELFFRGWRRVEVRRPVFVLGPPRSGTTHLHHVLSADPQTTTFRTWECLFGLSVTARRVLGGLGWLDHRFGRPFGRLGRWAARRWLGDMNEVHPFALAAPEEDFLALMPVLQCFILVAVFPAADDLWRTARLDQQSPQHRSRLMNYYRMCVKKHLYAAGGDFRFLSKNASFSGSAESLLDTFPDAVILACSRDPLKTVPSQMSSLAPALSAAGFREFPGTLRDRLSELLRHYYLALAALADARPDQVVVIDNHALRDRLAETVRTAFERVGLPMTDAFARSLESAGRESRDFRSGHRYSLETFGLNEADLRCRFDAVYRRYAFGPPAVSDPLGRSSSNPR